jgi:hypothetical protein
MQNGEQGRAESERASTPLPTGEDLPEPERAPLNPEILGGQIHPFVKLASMVEAARKVSWAIETYFPVAGEPWQLDQSNSPALAQEVITRITALESWINPGNLPFRSAGRTDLQRISGLLPFTQISRPGLWEALENLIGRFDAIVRHYELEDKIHNDSEPCFVWWPAQIRRIKRGLLARLEGAADTLWAVISEDRCREYLDYCWAKMQRSGDAKPGFLGIVLDEGRREARRVGYPTLVLKGKPILWELLWVLEAGRTNWRSKSDLRNSVWEPLNKEVEDNAIEKAVSNLKPLLRDLGVTIESERPMGYRLAELQPIDAS